MSNSDSGGPILKDLMIDDSDMFTDPLAFGRRLYAEAERLAGICKQDTGVNALTQEMKRKSEEVDVPVGILQELQTLYERGDEISIPELIKLIEAVGNLQSDLKNTLRDRVTREATMENSTIREKRIAHLQYVQLRKAYDAFRQLVKFLDASKKEPVFPKLKIIPALPGNYGGTTQLEYFMFTIKGQEGEWFSYRAVAKELGLKDRFDTLRDFIEWCETPEGLEVVEVRKVKK